MENLKKFVSQNKIAVYGASAILILCVGYFFLKRSCDRYKKIYMDTIEELSRERDVIDKQIRDIVDTYIELPNSREVILEKTTDIANHRQDIEDEIAKNHELIRKLMC